MVALFYRSGRRESPDAVGAARFFALDTRATVEAQIVTLGQKKRVVDTTF